MKKDKIIYAIVILVIVGSVMFLGSDVLKLLKLEYSFYQTQTENRFSSKDVMKSIKYSSTDNVVENKEIIFEEIKKFNNELISKKEEIGNNVFEIKNIHKIKDYYMEYKKYLIVKYKIYNIIEDMPNLYKNIKTLNDSSLSEYFNSNIEILENIYGFTAEDEFKEFTKSLEFFNNTKVESVSLRISSIMNDAENCELMFAIVVFAENGKNIEYNVKSNYYKTTDKQTAPYVTISEAKKFD